MQANVFVHFQPVDHEAMNQHDVEEALKPKKKIDGITSHITNMLFPARDAKKVMPQRKGNIGGHEQDNHDEEHVQRHMDEIDREHKAAAAQHAAAAAAAQLRKDKAAASPDEQIASIKATLKEAREKARLMQEESALERAESLRQEEEDSREVRFNRRFTNVASFLEGGKELSHDQMVEKLRDAAANGNYADLAGLLDETHVPLIHAKDENDWQIIHEAIRGGDLDCVKLLVDLGADIEAKTMSGGAALWVAKYYLEEGDPIIQYLKDIGAPDEEVEL